MSVSTTPLFSIVIPTYNRAEGLLRLAIEAAVAQSFPDLEILISDNCSTDGTEALVRSFADSRIRYIKHPVNLGPVGNFKYCIEQARGHYWLMLHDDDLIDSDFVSACVTATEGRLDYGMIRTGVRLVDTHGAIKEQLRNVSRCQTVDEFVTDWFAGRAPLYLCNTVFHRAKLIEVGGFVSKKNLYNDVVAEVRIAAISPILNIEEIKASFRRHEDNRGGSIRLRDWAEESAFLLDEIVNVVTDKRGVKAVGQRYFSGKLYQRADLLPQLRERWKSYRIISETFDHCYTPYQRVWTRARRRLGRMRRRLLPI